MWTVLGIIVLVVVAAGIFFWALNGMLTHICPTCLASAGTEENLVPVIPLARWWCPTCSNIHKHGDVLESEPGTRPAASEPATMASRRDDAFIAASPPILITQAADVDDEEDDLATEYNYEFDDDEPPPRI